MRIILLIGLIFFSLAASAQKEDKAERIFDAGAKMKVGTASIIGGTGVVVAAGGTAWLIHSYADVPPEVPLIAGGLGVTAGLAAVTFGTIQIVKASKQLSSVHRHHHTSPPVLSISATGTGAKLQLRF